MDPSKLDLLPSNSESKTLHITRIPTSQTVLTFFMTLLPVSSVLILSFKNPELKSFCFDFGALWCFGRDSLPPTDHSKTGKATFTICSSVRVFTGYHNVIWRVVFSVRYFFELDTTANGSRNLVDCLSDVVSEQVFYYGPIVYFHKDW